MVVRPWPQQLLMAPLLEGGPEHLLAPQMHQDHPLHRPSGPLHLCLVHSPSDSALLILST